MALGISEAKQSSLSFLTEPPIPLSLTTVFKHSLLKPPTLSLLLATATDQTCIWPTAQILLCNYKLCTYFHVTHESGIFAHEYSVYKLMDA